MTAVAYYRSWSKRVEKPAHAPGNHPTEQARRADDVQPHLKALDQPRRK